MRLSAQHTYGPGVKICGCALSKATRQETNVGRHIDKHGDKLAGKLHDVLSTWGKKLGKKAATALRELRKGDEGIVQPILQQLGAEALGLDLVDEMTPSMLAAFRAAGLLGLGQVKFKATHDITKQLDAAAKQYAEDHGAELVKDLAGTTEDYLRSVVTNGVEEGMSPDGLASAIEASGAFGEARAETIARTELAFAHVRGNIEGWKQTGEVEGKKWYTAPGCCDECEDLDGEVVSIDDDFPDDGGIGPPLHPNCRCTVLAVLTKDGGDEEQTDDTEGDEE